MGINYRYAHVTVEKLVRRYGGKRKLVKDFKGKPEEAYKALQKQQEALCRSFFMDPNIGEVIEEDGTRIMDFCDNLLT